MRSIALVLVLATLSTLAAEPTYPHWDGRESIDQYAKRTGLEPTKTIDLGGGVTMEMVLIPAGKFMMGTEKPPEVDGEAYRNKILTGQIISGIGSGALLVLLGVVLIRAIRKRRRPQYSLAWFLFMAVVAGIGLMGGLHWYFSTRAFDEAQKEYEAAMARFRNSDDKERPAHEVTLTKPYYMGRYEVTNREFRQITGMSVRGSDDLPAAWLPWNGAQAFCKKTSERTGLTVRLPTEAEWEYACRAGTSTSWYHGDVRGDTDRVVWHNSNSNGSRHPVGQKEPNRWGTYDMHGNVSEWCQDVLRPYGKEAATDPIALLPDTPYRVARGGCFNDPLRYCRSASRSTNDYLLNAIGFRVVLDPKP